MEEIILIGVDTNVFLDSLEILRKVAVYMESLHMKFFVPSIILRELDILKVRSPEARNALRYIEEESQKNNSQIVLDKYVSKDGKINDDIFLVACTRNNVSVYLTNDTCLRIKVQAVEYASISTINKNAEELFIEIRGSVKDVEFMDYALNEEVNFPEGKIEEKLAHWIYIKKVHPVLSRELGPNLISHYVPDNVSSSIKELLSYITKNYSMFDGVFPRYGKKILVQISKSDLTDENIDRMLGVLGIEPPTWYKTKNSA
ncbi:hypothetical protein NEFER03_0152 [Nematocida sp. LUAm3]|nr:hypothetical protein NEFER03_0152 [Nematocida sp. LUAm3]KAI5173605.1 hypothetical protein NEFER02_0121 [Nematocida sp. LUAm2]KAI5176826.1 hypothetical protein NEFER01_0151 [Nematocida sp. LUAm1]